jgi:hypothetical protein
MVRMVVSQDILKENTIHPLIGSDNLPAMTSDNSFQYAILPSLSVVLKASFTSATNVGTGESISITIHPPSGRTDGSQPLLPIRTLRRRMTVKKKKTTIIKRNPIGPFRKDSSTGSYRPD